MQDNNLKWQKQIFCQLILLLYLVCCPLSFAEPAPNNTQATLNFSHADIEEVLKAVSHFTGRAILLDPRVKGSINLISNGPVNQEDAWHILLSALRMQGFAVITSGKTTKVVPENDAKTLGQTVLSSQQHRQGDEFVTRVFVLSYESANQVVTALKPLVSNNNLLISSPSNNVVVISDYASNINRVARIIDTLDRPNQTNIDAIVLRYATATDMVPVLASLFDDGQRGLTVDGGQRLILVAEPHTNAILMRGGSQARRQQAEKLIRQLDQQQLTSHQAHMVYLKYADASQLAQTLRGVLTPATNTLPSSPSSNKILPATIANPGQNQNNTNGINNIVQAAISTPSAIQIGSVAIQADPATNSLLVQAPQAQYQMIRNLIEQLDVRRAQVFVESLIVEVNAEKAAELGFQFQAFSGVNGSGLLGGTNFGTSGNILNVAQNPTSLSAGLNIGGAHGQITLPGINVPILNLGSLGHFLETQANANILSTPTILTLDNEEARIMVGQNVPFVTGQYAQTGSAATASPFQTIERKDIGLTLRIKPQITAENTVKLVIYQETSSLQPLLVANRIESITTNKRAIESTVLVDNGQVVVIGGLIEEQVTDNTEKVPLLGDIPILGRLFRSDTRKRRKTNLMVFLRPIVIRAPEPLQQLTNNRYTQLGTAQHDNSQQPHLFGMPDLAPTPLPRTADQALTPTIITLGNTPKQDDNILTQTR